MVVAAHGLVAESGVLKLGAGGQWCRHSRREGSHAAATAQYGATNMLRQSAAGLLRRKRRTATAVTGAARTVAHLSMSLRLRLLLLLLLLALLLFFLDDGNSCSVECISFHLPLSLGFRCCSFLACLATAGRAATYAPARRTGPFRGSLCRH